MAKDMSSLEAVILSSNGNPNPQCQITPDAVPQSPRHCRGRVFATIHACPMTNFQTLLFGFYDTS